MPGTYIYPASEQITDKLELAMDPYKLDRERSALSLSIQFDWELALDIGSGVGRYFTAFAQAAGATPTVKRSLIAIEPDAARAEAARREAQRVAALAPNLEISVLRSQDSIHPQQFDLITCSQVIGHLSLDGCARLLRSIQSARRPRSAVVLLLPMTMNDAIERLVPWSAEPTSDYYYSVDLNRTPYQTGYATALRVEEYESMVNAPVPDRLPVRAFHVGAVSIPFAGGYPATLLSVPDVIRESLVIDSHFSFVYSVHRFSDVTGRAILADGIVRVS